MRLLLIIALTLIISGLLAAEESPVEAYLSNPGMQSHALALDHLRAQYSSNPQELQLTLNLAYILNHEAVRLMDLASQRLDEMGPGERFGLANMYLEMQQYEKAITIYDNINKESPKWSCPWRHKGEALFRSGQYDLATKSLEQAIETNKEHYDAYVWQAKALYRLGRYEDAKVAMDTAFKLDPEAEDSDYDDALSEDELKNLYQDILDKLK